MRIRTFDLFEALDMTAVKNPDAVKIAANGSLIPYKLTSDKTPNLYNGVRVINETPTADAFKIKDIPKKYDTVA